MKINNLAVVIGLALIVSIVAFFALKSNFNDTLSGTPIRTTPPKKFPPYGEQVPSIPPLGTDKVNYPQRPLIPLAPPTVPEEIGLAMKYPQGTGVGMSPLDSNAFVPTKPGPLLTSYSIPEAYAESSLSDPTGVNGSNQGSRIIKIKNTGNQMEYKPIDEAENLMYAAAYSNREVPNGLALINGAKNINYNSSFNPEKHLKLQSSPGQNSNLPNCDTTYPGTEHYDDLCITDGDIPYGKIVNGKVNPRLVSRWQSYTGDYNRAAALQDIDGLLYPKLNVLTNQ